MPVIAVGLTGIQLVPRDPYRVSLLVENRHATATVYIDTMPPPGITTLNASIRVGPNEYIVITEEEDGDIIHDQWSIVSDTAATTVAYKEGWKARGS